MLKMKNSSKNEINVSLNDPIERLETREKDFLSRKLGEREKEKIAPFRYFANFHAAITFRAEQTQRAASG